MNAPRCSDEDYIQFLLASPRMVSATEAARVQPCDANAPAHDAFTRLLHRLEPDPATLWQEVEGEVERTRGVLVLDDSTLDKPCARKIELVHRHWSGKHHAVVDGINLITVVWTDGDAVVPCDWRVFDKPHDGITKNEHFAAMLLAAKQRGFAPECVVFASWYASVDNLRLVRDCGWRWLMRLALADATEKQPPREREPHRVSPDGRMCNQRNGHAGVDRRVRAGASISDRRPER